VREEENKEEEEEEEKKKHKRIREIANTGSALREPKV